jgi:electron transfer flavoprotein-quinone oxidoreductase
MVSKPRAQGRAFNGCTSCGNRVFLTTLRVSLRRLKTMEKFDVIVVGAGLAGLAAAYTLAGNGVEVLILERGDYPGAKNVSGGRLYVNPVRKYFPELWDGAPMERHIVHEGLSLMAKERSLTMDYHGRELREEPHQSYSVLRSKFDRWLAEKAESKGAMLLSKTRVDDVIYEQDKITGVMAGGDGLNADVVIACDGVLSLVSEKAGIRSAGKPHDYAVGIKELIALESGVINERFNLEGDEGAARLYVGQVTKGRFGGGFLYTNRESVSLGIVIGIDEMLNDATIDAPALIEDFKQNPEISGLVRGGTTIEYSAHVIPEGGLKTLSALYGDGILVAGDAAGLALNMGFTVRGMEYALASGYFAAQAAIRAKEKGDFSAETLSAYKTLLEESFVLKDFSAFKETPDVLRNQRIFNHYPEMIGGLLKDLYSVSDHPKETIYQTLKRNLSMGEIWSIIKDMTGVRRI